jgi:YhcH/YjgK/YiaL family protein
MIVDAIENLNEYSSRFQSVNKVLEILENISIEEFSRKTHYGEIILIPLNSVAVLGKFDHRILEAHKAFLDIHITLEGIDVIAFADLEHETSPLRDYDVVNDYSLWTSDNIKTLSVPKGFFCIIPNSFAHMALYNGHSKVKKIVLKMPVNV